MENTNEEKNQNPQIAFTDTEQAPASVKLKSAWQLFKEAWKLYRSKFKTLIGIMILPVIISIILKELSIVSIYSPTLSQASWLSAVKIIIWLILLYFQAVSIAALLFAVKDDIGIKESYGRAIKSSLSYVLVVIIELLVIAGGFILFIIPGIILLLWFSLAVYAFVFEDKRGIEALYRSKQLISGNFWRVVWRSIFICIVVLIIIIPLAIIAKVLNDSHGLMDNLLRLFIAPLVIFFEAFVFQDLVKAKQGSTLQAPSKFGKFSYYFSAVIGVPLVLGLFMLQGLLFITHDIPSPNDADLQLPVLNIPKESNAYFQFSEANDVIYLPKDNIQSLSDLSENKNWDDALANDILNKNEKALNFFEAGIALPVYQVPELENPANYSENLVLKGMASIRNLAKVNSIKALYLSRQGKDKEALDQSLKTIKMGQMFEDNQGALIQYLVGMAVKEIGLSNFRTILKYSHLSSTDLINYEKELDKYKESKIALQNTLKSEYIMLTNSKILAINPIFRGEKPAGDNELSNELSNELLRETPPLVRGNNFYYKPNETQNCVIKNYRKMVDVVGKNNYGEISKENLIEKTPINSYNIFFTENAVGNILCDIIGSIGENLATKKFQESFSVKETQLLLALKAYKQDTGNLPDSLDNLIPKYIPEIPQDPFDGKTIKYSPEKKIIYSTGKDLIDNGGSISESDWRQGDDLGFKIDF
ncbi:MAG: hypothetical protein Q7S18_00530 [bacterium]|nr:hypothetical protein [bacterium]